MRNGVAFSALLSFPVFFTIGTGNNTLFAAIFTMIYLFWYDSSNRYQREMALISLAAAAATKLAPAIFGILLLYEKRWKDALRTIIYGVVLGVLPFCVFGGGIRYNLPLWMASYTVDNLLPKYIQYYEIWQSTDSTFAGGIDGAFDLNIILP